MINSQGCDMITDYHFKQFKMKVHSFVKRRLVVLLCDPSKYVIHMFQLLENFI